MNRLRFTRVRDVKSPSRANSGDAGLDFYIPTNLKPEELNEKNNPNTFILTCNTEGCVQSILLEPHSRILIPSGIRVLIEPKDSMLMAANKSGISTKKGLIYTAEIVDSPYTGEVHIGLLNTNDTPILIPVGKAIQFIHIPIYLTNPEEISLRKYNKEASTWGTRGEKAFGSSDNY